MADAVAEFIAKLRKAGNSESEIVAALRGTKEYDEVLQDVKKAGHTEDGLLQHYGLAVPTSSRPSYLASQALQGTAGLVTGPTDLNEAMYHGLQSVGNRLARGNWGGDDAGRGNASKDSAPSWEPEWLKNYTQAAYDKGPLGNYLPSSADVASLFPDALQHPISTAERWSGAAARGLGGAVGTLGTVAPAGVKAVASALPGALGGNIGGALGGEATAALPWYANIPASVLGSLLGHGAAKPFTRALNAHAGEGAGAGAEQQQYLNPNALKVQASGLSNVSPALSAETLIPGNVSKGHLEELKGQIAQSIQTAKEGLSPGTITRQTLGKDAQEFASDFSNSIMPSEIERGYAAINDPASPQYMPKDAPGQYKNLAAALQEETGKKGGMQLWDSLPEGLQKRFAQYLPQERSNPAQLGIKAQQEAPKYSVEMGTQPSSPQLGTPNSPFTPAQGGYGNMGAAPPLPPKMPVYKQTSPGVEAPPPIVPTVEMMQNDKKALGGLMTGEKDSGRREILDRLYQSVSSDLRDIGINMDLGEMNKINPDGTISYGPKGWVQSSKAAGRAAALDAGDANATALHSLHDTIVKPILDARTPEAAGASLHSLLNAGQGGTDLEMLNKYNPDLVGKLASSWLGENGLENSKNASTYGETLTPHPNFPSKLAGLSPEARQELFDETTNKHLDGMTEVQKQIDEISAASPEKKANFVRQAWEMLRTAPGAAALGGYAGATMGNPWEGAAIGAGVGPVLDFTVNKLGGLGNKVAENIPFYRNALTAINSGTDYGSSKGLNVLSGTMVGAGEDNSNEK